MQGKTTVIAAAALAAAIAGLIGWQSWNNHRLQQELSALQPQLAAQKPVADMQINRAWPADPLLGSNDPFVEMQRMQAEMHQRCSS